jgi:ABC-type transport system involved in multi-copper enzyme maturation permease subunit
MSRALLTFRIHRFEAVALAILAAAVLGAAGGLWLRLLAFNLPASCFFNGDQFDPGCAARQLEVNDYFALAGDIGMYVVLAIVILPFALGLIFGVAIVSKEIERGTAAFAWSIAPSRRRWLLGVALPAFLAVLGTSIVAGLLSDRLELVRDPSMDPARTLHHVGLRGVAIPAYAIAAFGIALAVGARLGRVLPALLLAGALSIASVVGGTFAVDAMLDGEFIPVEESQMLETRAFSAGRVFDTQILTPDGELIPWGTAYERFGEAIYPENLAYDPAYRTFYLVTPGDLYPIAEWRFAVILGAIGLGGIVLAFAIVERRRPT